MIDLKIAGVPEHFNLPWHLWIEQAADDGASVRWLDFAAGSGAMSSALDALEVDAALLLTEAAIAGIANGGRYRIVSLYTLSPLLWGIHVPAESRFRERADVGRARFAISRRGSGSHLMAYALADAEGWPTEQLQFEIVGSLGGAIEAFREGRADVFLWEKFMTKPIVDAGTFRRIGDFVAPWPAFVVCAAESTLERAPDALATVLAGVFEQAARLVRRPDAAALIAGRYGLAETDVLQWLQLTRWADAARIDVDAVAPATALLAKRGLIDASFRTKSAWAALPDR
jgi:sulfonate transport system substrate-binding protein